MRRHRLVSNQLVVTRHTHPAEIRSRWFINAAPHHVVRSVFPITILVIILNNPLTTIKFHGIPLMPVRTG